MPILDRLMQDKDESLRQQHGVRLVLILGPYVRRIGLAGAPDNGRQSATVEVRDPRCEI